MCQIPDRVKRVIIDYRLNQPFDTLGHQGEKTGICRTPLFAVHSRLISQLNHEPLKDEQNMFDRLTTGWQLAKQSFNVLKLDKELLMFPLFSGIACVIVTASFAIPVFFSGMLENVGNEQAGGVGVPENVLFYVLMFLFYFVTYFVIIFFNSALVACAIIRLKGGDPILSDGFGAAMARLPQIAGWALVAASVGLILKIIESRSRRFGRIVTGLLGMAWSITTFFVIPVLVVEKAGPIDAVKRSVAIMKKTWGESLSANFGIGLITFLASLIGILPIVGGVAALDAQMAVLGIALIGIGGVLLLVISLISSALGTIMLAALYIYAEEGTVAGGFDASMIQKAFARK